MCEPYGEGKLASICGPLFALEDADGAEHRRGDRFGAQNERAQRYDGEAERGRLLDFARSEAAFRAHGEGERAPFAHAFDERARQWLGRVFPKTVACTWVCRTCRLESLPPRKNAEDARRIGASALARGLLGDAPPSCQLGLLAIRNDLRDGSSRSRDHDACRTELRCITHDRVDFVTLRVLLNKGDRSAGQDGCRAKLTDGDPGGFVRWDFNDRVGFSPGRGIERDESIPLSKAKHTTEVMRCLPR